MRTNIELNDDLLREAGRYTRTRTKRGLVEEALRTFIEVKARQQRTAAYEDRLALIERRLGALRLREAPTQVLRADRDRP